MCKLFLFLFLTTIFCGVVYLFNYQDNQEEAVVVKTVQILNDLDSLPKPERITEQYLIFKFVLDSFTVDSVCYCRPYVQFSAFLLDALATENHYAFFTTMYVDRGKVIPFPIFVKKSILDKVYIQHGAEYITQSSVSKIEKLCRNWFETAKQKGSL